MQAIKDIISPSTGEGQITGEGTHFGSEKPQPSRTNTEKEIDNATYTYKTYPLGGAQVRQNSTPHVPGEFPPPTPLPGAQPSSEPAAAPLSTVPDTSEPVATGNPGQSDLDHGRDAALVGAAASDPLKDEPTSTSAGGSFTGAEGTATTSHPIATSTTYEDQRAEPVHPQGQDHSYGKDAAVVGGGAAVAGAGVLAADEFSKNEHAVTDQTAPAIVLHNPSSGVSPTTVPADADNETQTHHGRDAALVGGGAAAAGAGAFALSEHDSSAPVAETAQAGGAGAVPAAAVAEDTPKEVSHVGRDAAIVGGGAAVAGGAAAADVGGKERQKLQKQQAKEAEKQQKEAAKRQKEAEKQAAKQEKENKKKAEKEADKRAKLEKENKKQADKDAAAAEEQRQGEADKEDQRTKEQQLAAAAALEEANRKSGLEPGGVSAEEREKALEAQRQVSEGRTEDKDEKTKKRRSIFGFLSRDKSKDEQRDDQPSSPSRGIAEERDYRDSGSPARADDEHGGKHHSKLHKEPPRKVREELEQKAEEMRQEGRHVGTDGEIGSGEAQHGQDVLRE